MYLHNLVDRLSQVNQSPLPSSLPMGLLDAFDIEMYEDISIDS